MRLDDCLELGLDRVVLDLFDGSSNLCVFLYSSKISSELDRFLSGSHVSSLDPYSFHLTRYSIPFPFRQCVRIVSTSYSSSVPINSGGGLMKLGPCSSVS